MEKWSQKNILGRHSRHHQLTLYWHAVWSPELQIFALSFLRIFETTCSLRELIQINLTFQENEKAVLLPTIQDPRLAKEAKIHGIVVTDKRQYRESPGAWNPDDPDIRFDAQPQITINVSFAAKTFTIRSLSRNASLLLKKLQNNPLTSSTWQLWAGR